MAGKSRQREFYRRLTFRDEIRCCLETLENSKILQKQIKLKGGDPDMYAIVGMGEESQNIETPCMLFETRHEAEKHLAQIPWRGVKNFLRRARRV